MAPLSYGMQAAAVTGVSMVLMQAPPFPTWLCLRVLLLSFAYHCVETLTNPSWIGKEAPGLLMARVKEYAPLRSGLAVPPEGG